MVWKWSQKDPEMAPKSVPKCFRNRSQNRFQNVSYIGALPEAIFCTPLRQNGRFWKTCVSKRTGSAFRFWANLKHTWNIDHTPTREVMTLFGGARFARRPRIDQTSIQNRSNIDPKSIKHRSKHRFKNRSKHGSKIDPKSVPKWSQNRSKIGPKMVPKSVQNRSQNRFQKASYIGALPEAIFCTPLKQNGRFLVIRRPPIRPVCMYTFIHLYTYTFIHVYIYTLIHLYNYTLIHLYIYTFIHLYTYTLIHLYIYTFIYLYTYTVIHLYNYTFIHLYIYTFF